MLSFEGVSLRRGPRLLFHEATFAIHDGEKVGIVGTNGSGKSSLLALVRNELLPDAGEVSLPGDRVIAHVAQETPATEQEALAYVLGGDGELAELHAALAAAEATDDGARQAALHGRLEAIDGYTAPARAARIMHGLGFVAPRQRDPVRSFSGGWRMRLNLARALMCRSDLLLLDEPTNHLDLEAVLWLEAWLAGYRGTLLLISHDRDFLDRVAGRILHVADETVRLYTGNYSGFELQRAERLAQQQAVFDRQQREAAHIKRFVERFRAKASKARQAQSRLKALARLEAAAPAHSDSPFHFTFPRPQGLPNPLLRIEAASVGYGEEPVLRDIDARLTPGDRIGLIGVNGAGKSSLIRLLAGELTPQTGTVEPAPTLRIGYFAQHQLEQLRPEHSPLDHLRQLDPAPPEQALRDFLGGFGFSGDAAVNPVAPLSGGEKARLVLALTVYQKPNLLLLDEPTNHLDLEMRHALTLALQEYEGALILVSHDRHLLESTTDTFWLVADGAVTQFEGDLDDYRRRLETAGTNAARPPESAPAHSAVARREQRRLDADKRQREQPLRNRLRELEREIESLSARRQSLDEQLADPAIYAEENKGELRERLAEKADLESALNRAEEAWMEVAEALQEA